MLPLREGAGDPGRLVAGEPQAGAASAAGSASTKRGLLGREQVGAVGVPGAPHVLTGCQLRRTMAGLAGDEVAVAAADHELDHVAEVGDAGDRTRRWR